MAHSGCAPSTQPVPLSQKNENFVPVSSKIAGLNESRNELLNRIQGLKKDMQEWRLKLDTQVKVHLDELSELKKTLNVEVGQLRSEFQELRTTLRKQQDDVTTSLSNLMGVQEQEKTLQNLVVQEVPKMEQKAEDIQS